MHYQIASNTLQTFKNTYVVHINICGYMFGGYVNLYVQHTIRNLQYENQTWGSIDPCMIMATVLGGKRRPRAIISVNESCDRGIASPQSCRKMRLLQESGR